MNTKMVTSNIDFTKLLSTKSKKNVSFVKKVNHPTHPNLLIINDSGIEKVTQANNHGNCLNGMNVFNRKIKVTKWLNIYKHDNVYGTRLFFDSEAEAFEQRATNYVATVRIEFEE